MEGAPEAVIPVLINHTRKGAQPPREPQRRLPPQLRRQAR
jgi:hypothetical protein